MNRYKCPACGGNQYTACSTSEKCIHCGYKGQLMKMDKLEPEGGEGMREIKFRGKRIDNTEWIRGGYIKRWNGVGYKHYIHDELYEYEVDRGTVGQYTGLKDKNGTEIYEGDVCVCKKQGIMADAFEIFWMNKEGCWGWKESKESLDPFYQSIANYTEVISNKWDNPELLGGAE